MDRRGHMCAVSWLVVQDGKLVLECRDLFGIPHPGMLGLPYQIVAKTAAIDKNIIERECVKRYACKVISQDLILDNGFTSDTFSARCYLVHLDRPIQTSDPYIRLVAPRDAMERAHPLVAEAICRVLETPLEYHMSK